LLASGKKPTATASLEEGEGGGDDGNNEEEENENEDEEDGEDDDMEGKAAAQFCSEWLLSSQRAIVATLLFQLLSVPKMDECGLKQLSADLDYFLNVTAALGLPRHFLVAHLSALAKVCVNVLVDVDKEV
jgi:hypothetical protein